MTNYICSNGHTFIHPAKRIRHYGNLDEIKQALNNGITVAVDTVETFICPHCVTATYSEAPELQPEAVQVTGDWATVNKLLAEGWIIKSAYSKEYHMWKCKQ